MSTSFLPTVKFSTLPLSFSHKKLHTFLLRYSVVFAYVFLITSEFISDVLSGIFRSRAFSIFFKIGCHWVLNLICAFFGSKEGFLVDERDEYCLHGTSCHMAKTPMLFFVSFLLENQSFLVLAKIIHHNDTFYTYFRLIHFHPQLLYCCYVWWSYSL